MKALNHRKRCKRVKDSFLWTLEQGLYTNLSTLSSSQDTSTLSLNTCQTQIIHNRLCLCCVWMLPCYGASQEGSEIGHTPFQCLMHDVKLPSLHLAQPVSCSLQWGQESLLHRAPGNRSNTYTITHKLLLVLYLTWYCYHFLLKKCLFSASSLFSWLLTTSSKSKECRSLQPHCFSQVPWN